MVQPESAATEPPRRGGKAPPIILVPGIDGTALLFYRQLPLLTRAFDVVSFPLPVEAGLTMTDHVELLRQFVTTVTDGGAILVGESFGGALSLSTALAHPEVVRGLVIINSFPWLANRLQLWLGPWALRALPWGAMPALRRVTESRLHSAHTLPGDRSEFHRRALAIDRRSYIRRLELLRRYDVRPQLGAIAVPTLFLAADQDRLVPSLPWARYMAQRVPNSALAVLEGYGHSCLITHDLDLLDHVGPWWNQVAGEELGPGS
jgi:pimeloyl-ACP methyl ester carboxylesterase